MSDLPDLEISKLPSIDAVNKDTDYLVVSKESTAYASGYGSFKVTPNQLMQAVSTADLSDLEDVNISSPENDQVLKYNGSSWVNSDDDKGAEVEANPSETPTDTLTSIKIDDDVYSIEGGGSNVIANPTGAATDTLNKLQVDETIYHIEGGGVSSLTDLDDTSISNPTNGQVLKYNSSTSKWENDEGGGSADYVELTQLQYDALSDAEKKNGKMYFITDANGDGSRFMPVIYSLEEREIGVWTDGKPLYEKTIIKSSGITSGNDVAIPHNISNIDNICAYTGYALLSNGSGYVNYSDNEYYVEMHEASRTNTMWKIGNNIAPQIGSLIIVLRYTKTTDVAGSGTWTPQGVPSHHYSTNEQVVGTWVDGSTLYEKTINFGALPDSTEKPVAHSISNVDKIWVYDGFVFTSSNTFYGLVHTTGNSQTMQYAWDTNVDRTNVTIATYSDRSTLLAYVTIRYTKTST